MLSGCDVLDGLDMRQHGPRHSRERQRPDLPGAAAARAGDALAQEFTEADIRQPQRPNGVTAPDDDIYKALAANNFADWRLEVAGLVEKPLSLSLATSCRPCRPHADHPA